MLMTMLALAIALLVAQAPCTDAGLRRPDVRDAASVDDALEAVRRTSSGCESWRVVEAYLEGLLAAEQAWREGGSPSSLEPVRTRMRELSGFARAGSSVAELATMVLAAEAAAAQNEMAEMVILFEQAAALELQQRLAGADELPVVSVHEAAGECWLRLFRYDEAARAFARVRTEDRNPRVIAGEQRARAGMAQRGNR